MDTRLISSLQRVASERGTARLSILFPAGTVAFEAELTAQQITKLLATMEKRGLRMRRVL